MLIDAATAEDNATIRFGDLLGETFGELRRASASLGEIFGESDMKGADMRGRRKKVETVCSN